MLAWGSWDNSCKSQWMTTRNLSLHDSPVGGGANACSATCWLGWQAVISARWRRLQLCAATHISGPNSWHSCLSISFTVLEEVDVQSRAACAHGGIVERAVELQHTCTS